MRRVILVDGNNLMCRAHYAAAAWQSRPGEPPSGLWTFRSMMKEIRLAFPMATPLVVFDPGGVTSRMVTDPTYKAHRSQPSAALQDDLRNAAGAAAGEGLHPLRVAGHEADDVIYTLACHARAEGWAVSVVTNDSDALQLVNDDLQTNVIAPVKGMSDVKIYDENAVLEKFGVWPGGIPDYKALVGDKSDGIPGAGGIGPKTAARLLTEFGSVEGVIRAASRGEKMKGYSSVVQAALTTRPDAIRANLALTQLRWVPDCPVIQAALERIFNPVAGLAG